MFKTLIDLFTIFFSAFTCMCTWTVLGLRLSCLVRSFYYFEFTKRIMVEYNEFISMQYHTVTRLVAVSIITPDGCGYNDTREPDYGHDHWQTVCYHRCSIVTCQTLKLITIYSRIKKIFINGHSVYVPWYSNKIHL